MQSAAPRCDFEQPPLTHAPRVLLKHDMSHHFTFVIGRLQGSQEKLGLIDPKVRSLGLLITSETPAAGHRPRELGPRLCRCVASRVQERGCQKHVPTGGMEDRRGLWAR